MRYLEFLKRQFLIAHISGIPVRVDYRWFLVLALMSWITASSINALVDNFLTSVIFGVMTTLIFFGSIFIHEYAHAVAARMEGVPAIEILLHPFGGLTKLKREPDTPRAEFRIAVAGPAASFLLAVLFVGFMALADSADLNILARLFFMIGTGNFLVAVFNLFPGYPLDGGRVLRAFLWRRGKDLNEATILTGRCGQIIAVALMIFGLYIAALRRDFFTGFWTILVGVFLFDAAKGIIQEISSFENLLVEEVMQLPVTVSPEMNVQHFVDRILSFNRQNVFPVARDKQLYGMLLLEDLKKIPSADWRATKVQAVMRAVTPDYFVETSSLLPEARILMRENGIGALGVIDAEGNLVGFVQRGRVKKRS
jgi:Zn-dependent protease